MPRRRRRSGSPAHVQRDTPAIARDPLLDWITRPARRAVLLTDPLLDDPLELRQLEDRREWTPEPFTRPARALDGPLSARLVPARPNPSRRRIGALQPLYSPPVGVAFARPHGVAVCVRRHQRREVLFAARRTGKGARSPRHRSVWSSVSCKR